MSFEKIFQSPSGKSALLSSFIAAVFLILIFLLPLAPYNEGAWYIGLYKDISIPEQDRYNFWLVFLETIFVLFFYFHLVVAFGNFAEVQNTLPGWREVFFPTILTGFFAFLVPRMGIAGDIVGSTGDLGYNHFTSTMTGQVFWFSIIGMVLIILYLMNTSMKTDQSSKK